MDHVDASVELIHREYPSPHARSPERVPRFITGPCSFGPQMNSP